MTDLTIQGAVQSCQGVFITGATVTLEGTGQSATTGSEGRYRIGPLANFLGGDYVLTASAAGYSPRSLPLTLPDTGVRTVSFAGVNCLQALPTATPTSTPTITPTPTPVPSIVFFDNVENGMNGWTVSHSGGDQDWRITDHEAYSQTHAWYGLRRNEASDIYLVSPAITLGPNAVLAFNHRYLLGPVTGWEGGVVEISTDNGTGWVDLGPKMILNGYNSQITTSWDSPLEGRQAFTGDSHDWTQTRVDLNSYASLTIRLRFRVGGGILSDILDGWLIDDIRIGNQTAIPAITPRPTVALNWSPGPDLQTERSDLGVVATSDGKIYAVAGSSYTTLSSVEMFDPNTNAWLPRASMAVPRCCHGLALVGDKLYVLAGEDRYGHYVYTTEEYNIAQNSWRTRASIPDGQISPGAAAAEGKVYLMGNDSFGAIVKEYDPNADTWTVKRPMSIPRYDLAAVRASNGKIYAIGGEEPFGPVVPTVEEYDPLRDTWRKRASMPTSRGYVSAVAASDGKIYVAGGSADRYGANLVSTVEVYDPATNTWAIGTSMPTARRGLGLAESNGRLYGVGGANRDGSLKTVEVAPLP